MPKPSSIGRFVFVAACTYPPLVRTKSWLAIRLNLYRLEIKGDIALFGGTNWMRSFFLFFFKPFKRSGGMLKVSLKTSLDKERSAFESTISCGLLVLSA